MLPKSHPAFVESPLYPLWPHKHAGVAARGFAVDLSDPRAVRGCLGDVMREMGAPVEVLHWNPYNSVRTPLLEMVADEVDELMGVGVKGGRPER